MRRHTFVLAIAAALLTAIASGQLAASIPRKGSAALVAQLAGKSYGQTQPLLAKLLLRRKQVALSMVAQLRSSAPATRAAAAFLIGTYRVSDGVPSLLRAIEFRSVTHILGSMLGAGWSYPCAWALVRIGMPSVRAILKALPQETNALRRKLMVRVLVGVEGRAVTRFRLKRAIAKAPDAVAKANLKAALADVVPAAHHR